MALEAGWSPKKNRVGLRNHDMLDERSGVPQNFLGSCFKGQKEVIKKILVDVFESEVVMPNVPRLRPAKLGHKIDRAWGMTSQAFPCVLYGFGCAG